MTILFLLSALFVLYTYALFPLILHLRARGKTLPAVATPVEWPSVSIVIAAHNEADNLPVKIASLEKLDYPPELLEWIIVSDGSTDGTHALLSREFEGYPQRHVKHLETSLGKCGALNEGVSMARHDIILFMDARQPVSADAIRKLVPFFAHEEVGAVSGELVLSEDNSLEAANFGLFWR